MDRPVMEHRPAVDLSTPEAVLAAVEAGVQPEAAAPRSRAPGRTVRSSASVPKELGRHRVEPGDSLTRIAREYYGTEAPAVIRAIYQANTGTMSGPNHLVVGREIALPHIGLGTESARGASSPTQREHSQPARPVRSPPAGEPSVYEIRPGDTLTRIARAHYNSTAASVIDAIYGANRTVLSGRDHLVVGRQIVLPVLETPDPASPPEEVLAARIHPPVVGEQDDEARPTSPRPPSSLRPTRHSTDWRWYQLKEGDVYSTVAARLLGTSKRWPELAELNKDIFPDPGRIRHGVSIRVPLDTQGVREVASRRGDRR